MQRKTIPERLLPLPVQHLVNNMTLRHELETIFFIFFASIIALASLFYLRSPKHMQQLSVATPLPNFVSNQLTPTPTPIPDIPKVTFDSWTSSDGKEKISMKTEQNPNLSKTYTFTLINTADNSSFPLFFQTVASTSSMTIPFNAFAPDNAYVFLQQKDNDTTHFLVFKTSGQPFANGQQYLDVTPLFVAHTASYKLVDVTGWAGPGLLIVNAKAVDGNANSSFWFDMSSESFISLANYFP